MKSALAHYFLASLFTSFALAATCSVPLDILFLIDASNSMTKYMRDITNTFYDVSKNYFAEKQPRDVRIAIATVGGSPSLILPFIRDSKDVRNLIKHSLEWVEDHSGSKYGFTDQKAGLEGLRIILANNTGEDLVKRCYPTNIPCELLWNSAAERLIIMVILILIMEI